MPQMGPMLWLILLMFTILNLKMMMNFIYFSWLPSKTKFIKKINSNNKNLKWF